MCTLTADGNKQLQEFTGNVKSGMWLCMWETGIGKMLNLLANKLRKNIHNKMHTHLQTSRAKTGQGGGRSKENKRTDERVN